MKQLEGALSTCKFVPLRPSQLYPSIGIKEVELLRR
jgi:hypothetical protein